MVDDGENIEAQRGKWKSLIIPLPRANPRPSSSLCSEPSGTWYSQPQPRAPPAPFRYVTCFPRAHHHPTTRERLPILSIPPAQVFGGYTVPRDLNTGPLVDTGILSTLSCYSYTLCDKWGPSGPLFITGQGFRGHPRASSVGSPPSLFSSPGVPSSPFLPHHFQVPSPSSHLGQVFQETPSCQADPATGRSE